MRSLCALFRDVVQRLPVTSTSKVCKLIVRLWFTDIHLIGVFKDTYVLTMTRSLSSANGRDAGKVSRGSMTASATSSCIRITAHSLATVAGSLLHVLMRSIVTVRHFPITPLVYRRF